MVGNQMLYQAELLPRGDDCKRLRQLKFAPTELSGGLAAMTIGAANIALFDFFEYNSPGSVVDNP